MCVYIQYIYSCIYKLTLYECIYKVATECPWFVFRGSWVSLKRVSSQCTDKVDSIHPNLCSFECVLFLSHPAYVHQLRVSSLGSYVCSPLEGVLSGSHG